jgi:hypothetical protein
LPAFGVSVSVGLASVRQPGQKFDPKILMISYGAKAVAPCWKVDALVTAVMMGEVVTVTVATDPALTEQELVPIGLQTPMYQGPAVEVYPLPVTWYETTSSVVLSTVILTSLVRQVVGSELVQ